MSSRLCGLLLAAVAAAGFVWAHHRYDRAGRAESPRPTTLDATPLFRRLMEQGVGGLDDVGKDLAASGHQKAAAEVAALLPRVDEPWVAVVEKLRSDPPRPPYPTPEGIEIVEPRDVLTPGPPRVFVRRAFPGRVLLRLHRAGGDAADDRRIEIPLGRWKTLSEDFALERGAAYVFSAYDPADPETVAATSRVEVLSSGEEELYRRRLNLLARYVSDVRVRRYAQVVLAMSGGLYGEASTLLERFGPPAADRIERGLDARLAFVYHRRGQNIKRDEALARLLR